MLFASSVTVTHRTLGSLDLVIIGIYFALVFGIVSETGPFRVGRAEAFEGGLFFGLFMLVGLMVIYERGWWLGLWTVLPPLLFFLSQISAFQLGRWIGRTGATLDSRARTGSKGCSRWRTPQACSRA